jgi:hypothetical protein
MNHTKQDMTVRSISTLTRRRLEALRTHTRLTYGSIVDDAVDALWYAYESDGQEIPICSFEAA